MASTQSKEQLAVVKQALRALGFNKQVLAYRLDSLTLIFLRETPTPNISGALQRGRPTAPSSYISIMQLKIKTVQQIWPFYACITMMMH